MVVIPVSAGFIKMISWSTIPRIRSCNDVFCSTKNIKFFHEYGHVPNKGLQNRMSCHCTTLSSVAVRGYQKIAKVSGYIINKLNNDNEKELFTKIWFYCFIVSGYLSANLTITFLKIWRYFWNIRISNDQLKHNSWQLFTEESLER